MSIEKQPYLPGFEDPKSKNEFQAESPEPKFKKSNLEPISNQVEKPKKITSFEIEKQANKFKNKALRMLKQGKAVEGFDGRYQVITYQDKDKTIQVKRKNKKYLVEVVVSNDETYILRFGGRWWAKIIGGLEATLHDEEFEKLSKEKPEPKGPITFIDQSSKKFDD
mgnify:CR=1 FL=1